MNLLALTKLASLSVLAALSAHAATTITVTPQVIRKAAEFEPLGVNNFGDIGGTKHSHGNLLVQSGFEPITMRDLYRVIESGEEHGKRWITLDGPGTSRYLLYTTGTYSGADMRAYRFVDSDGQPLPYKEAGWAQGGQLLDTKTATECIPLFTTKVLPKGSPDFPDGGWLVPGVPNVYSEWSATSKEEQNKIKEGWRVYYEADTPLLMDDVVIFTRSFQWPNPDDFHPRTTEKGINTSWNNVIGSSRFISSPSDTPVKMASGQGVLEITPKDGVAQVWHKLFGGKKRKDAFWYCTLEEGITYRFDAWVKTVDSTEGSLKIGLGGNKPNSLEHGYFGVTAVNKSFTATDTWQRIGYSFTAPPAVGGGIEGCIIRYEGTGTLLVDNVELRPIYEPGDETKPFVVNRRLFKTLMETQPATGRKGAARTWSSLSPDTMENLLNWNRGSSIGQTNQIRIKANQYIAIPKALTLLESTGDSPETRMVPWIITQVTHSETEYLQLIEYLAATYDPAVDSPDSKPFAYKRTQQRGNNTPWTDTFRELIIEFGNENWHNRAMADWIGMGRSGTVHQAGTEYGLWGGYIIDIMHNSPHWNAKIHVALGGNYAAGIRPDGSVTGYGQEATVAARGSNDYVGHATYIGPRWELNESSQTSIDDSGVQKTLYAYRPTTAADWAKLEETHDRIHEMGFKTKAVAYEGGPSGFGLRAKTPEEDRAGEYYGKSYAMGTAILDSWIDAWAKGWTYQCYLHFGQGKWWNSHTSISQGHRPSPGWLTQIMINRTVANLDLVTATVEGAPTLPVSGKKGSKAEGQKTDTPTIFAHAFATSGTVAVAAVNLDLHNAEIIEIQLPIKTAKSITQHYLAGDPRDTNLDEPKVELKTIDIPIEQFNRGKLNRTLPPGTGTIIVFKY